MFSDGNEFGHRKKRYAPRTRSGCLSCRQSHRKCDEERPTCSRCCKLGLACEYGVKLRWGGRPFAKSIFGRCLTTAADDECSPGSVYALPSGDDTAVSTEQRIRHGASFVYGIRQGANSDRPLSPCSAIVPHTCPPRTETSPSWNVGFTDSRVQNPIVAAGLVSLPSWVPQLPPHYRHLLDYFSRATNVFSCDESVQERFCQTLIPMAMTTSHLMASLLALAAVHRVNAGLEQSKAQLALLQSVVFSQLRSKLMLAPRDSSTEDMLATMLMMCYSDVVAGGSHWRVHVEGAASLLVQSWSVWSIHSKNPARAFITRCFVSVAALASVSPVPLSGKVVQQTLPMLLEEDSSITTHIDEFTSFSTSLIPVLLEIGLLQREICSLVGRGGPVDGVEACQVQMRAKAVIDYLQRMVELPMDLSEDSKRHISPPRQEDYKKVNKTYHEAALIQLRLRICQSPPSTEDVQKRVESILSLLSQVTLLDGSCPGTVMLFPLFWTGCGAISALQQGKVRTLLKKMVERYRLANASNSLRVLEDLWERRLQDELGDSKMPRQENWAADLILY